MQEKTHSFIHILIFRWGNKVHNLPHYKWFELNTTPLSIELCAHQNRINHQQFHGNFVYLYVLGSVGLETTLFHQIEMSMQCKTKQNSDNSLKCIDMENISIASPTSIRLMIEIIIICCCCCCCWCHGAFCCCNHNRNMFYAFRQICCIFLFSNGFLTQERENIYSLCWCIFINAFFQWESHKFQ